VRVKIIPNCVVAALLFLARVPLDGEAETRVGGMVNGTSRWSPEGNPYIVQSDIIVARSAELWIYPGTRIVIAEGKGADTTLPQFDKLDSGSVSIRVEGVLSCIGTKSKRITFVPAGTGQGKLGWYGIIFNHARGSECRVEQTDVTGAYNGITVTGCAPLIRGCVLEQNNVGVNCQGGGAALVFNCIITGNFSAGIRVQGGADPHIANSIILDNKNNGVWCDGSSKFTFEYNCVYGNGDGNFLDCDPLLGRYTKRLGKSDSVDYADNLYRDPLFFGTPADSIAFAHDLKIPTDRSLIKKVSLALIVNDTLRDSSYAQYKSRNYPRFTLSKYSPCLRTGDPAPCFKNINGTRNDRGIYGGPKKFDRQNN
jgi:parallel beta-helix repeat protein